MQSRRMLWLGLMLAVGCGRTALEDWLQPSQPAPRGGTAGTFGQSGGSTGDRIGSGAVGGNAGRDANAGKAGGDDAPDASAGEAGSGNLPNPLKPRYLAIQAFYASWSTRTALSLLDYSDPDAQLIPLIDSETLTSGQFSPLGRWFWFHEISLAETIQVIDLDLPPPFVSQQIGDGNLQGFAVAPDDEHFAYLVDESGTNELWLMEVAGAAFSEPDWVGTGDSLLGWADASTLLLVTEEHTLGIVRVTELGYSMETHSEVSLTGYPWAMSHGERSFLVATDHSYLVQHETGDTVDVGLDKAWTLSPGFELACGGSGAPYVLRALDGLDLSSPTADLWGTCPDALAFGHPWFASIEDEQPIVRQFLELGQGSYDIVDHLVPGDHDPPTFAEFAPNDAWLLLGTSSAAWLASLSADGVPGASQAIVTNGVASFSADSSHLAVTHDDPTRVGVIELQAGGPQPEELVPLTANWAAFLFSPDSSHAVFYGGLEDFGRALFLVDLADVEAQPRLLQNCKTAGGALPSCPNWAIFQPLR